MIPKTNIAAESAECAVADVGRKTIPRCQLCIVHLSPVFYQTAAVHVYLPCMWVAPGAGGGTDLQHDWLDGAGVVWSASV